MGDGSGGLEDYFQLIESEPAMCGGFVWEWRNHAICKGQAFFKTVLPPKGPSELVPRGCLLGLTSCLWKMAIFPYLKGR